MKYFSVLDLKDGFWQVQIELEEKSSKYCIFSTPFGCFKYNRLPFGLKIGPEVFQKLNFKYFGNLPGVGVYIDDLIIGERTQEEHDTYLNKVIKKSRECGIKFNNSKFQYKIEKVKYFGHIVTVDGVLPNPDKIVAIEKLPIPQN